MNTQTLAFLMYVDYKSECKKICKVPKPYSTFVRELVKLPDCEMFLFMFYCLGLVNENENMEQ